MTEFRWQRDPEQYHNMSGPAYRVVGIEKLLDLFVEPTKQIETFPGVVLIEDQESSLYATARPLLLAGIYPVCLQVNQDYPWTREDKLEAAVSNILKLADRNKALVIICDKGLGMLIDGIKLIRLLSLGPIPIIMLTGEPNTRETHKVANYLVEKDHGRTGLINTLKSSGIYPNQTT